MVNRTLLTAILTMVERDQRMRKKFRWDKEIDKRNTKLLKQIVEKYGWPDKQLVGAKGAEGAWLIVQHADHDVEFQSQCLKLMKKKAQNNLVPLRHVAYLTDRVLVNTNRRQLFGTQFYFNNKIFQPRPIYKPVNLDERRKLFGLEPFKIYRQRLISRQKKLSSKK